MSKSADNYVGILEAPASQYRKIMQIDDKVIWRFYELLSTRSADEIAALKAEANPLDAKSRFAIETITRFHGAEAAENAKAEFGKSYLQDELPADIAEHTVATEGATLWIAKALSAGGSREVDRRRQAAGGARRGRGGSRAGDRRAAAARRRQALPAQGGFEGAALRVRDRLPRVVIRGLARAVAVGLALPVATVSCAGAAAKTPAAANDAPLVTAPLTAIAPAASLGWLLDVEPRALLVGDATLAPAVAELVPDATFAAVARRYAVDLRAAEEVTLAQYPGAELLLVRSFLDPAKLEAAFAARALDVEGRAIDRDGSAVNRIVRTWGTKADGERLQLAVFGRQAAGLEIGRFGPLRASEAFARGKLHRASPALAAPPLLGAATAAGDAPFRFFVPGPFDAEDARGLNGMLAAATAVAVTLTPRTTPGRAPALEMRLVLTGSWARTLDGRPRAEAELLAQFQRLAQSPPGKLIGADGALESPSVTWSPETLVLTARYDAQTLARRLHLALEGPLEALLSPREKRSD